MIEQKREYEDYEGMMYEILKKLGVYHKRDDYIDLCWIGYSKAINNFDESKGTSLSTYIYKCAKNEVMKELKRESAFKRPQNNISLDESICSNGVIKSCNEPNLCRLEADMVVSEDKLELYGAINSLTDREKTIITHLFKLNDSNMSRSELAKHFGITETHITNLKNKALGKMKGSLENGQ